MSFPLRQRPLSALSLPALALSLAFFGLAQAAPTPAESQAVPQSKDASAVGAVVAMVPGIAFHGLGHIAAGNTSTGVQLLKWQGIGLAMMAASGSYLRFVGGSRYGNEVTIPVLMTGAGFFINTWLADIYGTATGGNHFSYQAPAKQSASLGYGYVRDPNFSYSHFSVLQGHIQLGEFTLAPSLWTALTANNQRGRLSATTPLYDNGNGQTLSLQGAFTTHHYGDEKFTNFTGEMGATFRLNNEYFDASLRGSYSSYSVGYGIERTRFSIAGAPSDWRGLLLGRFSYGIYLPKGGELEWYYDHRRDTFTAGLSPSSRNGSGFLGHFGVQAKLPLHSRFSLLAQGELGAAWLFHTSLELRIGDDK